MNSAWLVQRCDEIVCFRILLDQRISHFNCGLLLFALFLCECNRSYQRDVFGLSRRDYRCRRSAASRSIKPCVFQQPFCFDNALRSGSGSRLFRGRLYSAKQMVVNRLHLVDCSYCDMACCRRVMVEITGHMVK